MPTAYVKKLATEYNMTVEEVEKEWEKSKEIVDKNYPDVDKDSEEYWKLVSSITEKIVKAKAQKKKSYRFTFKK